MLVSFFIVSVLSGSSGRKRFQHPMHQSSHRLLLYVVRHFAMEAAPG